MRTSTKQSLQNIYKQRESDIQLQIIHYLKAKGHIVGKTKTMGVRRGRVFCFDPYTFRGKSDLESFSHGIMYCIEVKAGKNKIKEGSEQAHYRDIFHKPPDRIFIEAHSLEDVIGIIRQYDNKTL